jgi:hypothetical protein
VRGQTLEFAKEGKDMAVLRILGVVISLLVSVAVGRAQTYSLTETPQVGVCYRLKLGMKLSGEIRVSKDGQRVPLKLAATAEHEFPERILSVAKTGLPDKTARVYERAQALIVVDGERSLRQLRNDRKLIVVQRPKDRALVYSTGGPLLHEELELTGEHFDTLALSGLLPGKAVALGETWKVNNAVTQALCNFEGLTEQNLNCKLEQVKDDMAQVSVSGSATGIELGALVKATIDATYEYDLKSNHLTRLDWSQKDERGQGPASPATSVESRVVLTRTPLTQPEVLSDAALVSVPDGLEPPPVLTDLEYHDSKGRFDMVYGRDWQTVGQSDEHLVMRLMDAGDFVAQATLTPWTKAEKGKHLTPDEFHQAMMDTPGWELEQELQAGPVPNANGNWVYRLSALGQLDGTKVMQNFYLIAGPDGDQVVLVFTMTPKQADRLGNRDLSMAANVDFPKRKK